jgi:cytochrome c553
MNMHKSPIQAATVAALLTLVSNAWGQKNWDAPKIVTSYCSGCHGVDGNTQLPYFPKLAGLDAAYAGKKLTAFKEPSGPPVDELYWWTLKVAGSKKGAENITRQERMNMEGVAHAESSEQLQQAVMWYAKQPPAHGHAADNALIAQGQELFVKGVPAQKILACATCHGPDAAGKGLAPRLAGQNAEYLVDQLEKFSRGDRKHSPEMTMVTRDLDPNQARAAAAYLQSR